jgi:hypothetical protein
MIELCHDGFVSMYEAAWEVFVQRDGAAALRFGAGVVE